MQPFFSIVIPSYNRLNFLKKTLKTVFNQTFNNFEVIVVDDGSTDQTFEKLPFMFPGESRMRIIRQENQERGAARNTGIKNATGVYVNFIDSDDELKPDHLQILFSEIQKQNHPDFITTKFSIIRNGIIKSADNKKLKEGWYDYRLFLEGNPLACIICVRRENPGLCLFEENRKYAIKEDWMFLIENMSKNKLRIIDQITVFINDHNERSMRTDNQEIIKKTKLAHAWILAKIKLSSGESKNLSAHVDYFCAIHSYIDDFRKDSFKYLFNAISKSGMKKRFIVLMIKLLLGRKIITLFKYS